MEGKEKNEREEIFSEIVRAGKRTYFFDVKATRRNDYYLTLTESKKIFDKDGGFHFEKHKLFLYKEDFDKFADGLDSAIKFIKNSNPTEVKIEVNTEPEKVSEKVSEEVSVESDVEVSEPEKNFSDVSFEDLGSE
ncbi:DUF3276 family protein [Bacteroidota bacterium]